MSDLIKITGGVVSLLILACIGPIFTIWAANLLFGLAIPVTFGTWAAALWLAFVVKSSPSKS